MASINFHVSLKEAKSTRLQVRCAIHVNKTRKVKLLGYIPSTKIRTNGKTYFKHWDNKTNRVKHLDEATEINSKILEIETAFNELQKEHTIKGSKPTIEEIMCLFGMQEKKAIATKNSFSTSQENNANTITVGTSPTKYFDPKGKEVSYLIHVYDIFTKEKATEVKQATLNQYITFRDQLQAFEATLKGGCLNLEEVTQKTYKEFSTFLISKQNNVNSTINRKNRRFTTFMIWAQTEGYVNQGRFRKKFKLEELEANKFPLYENEINAFKTFIPGTKLESEVYWAFLFALETGLRYSDVAQLSPVHIFEADFDGEKVRYIDITEHKTSERSTVPLSNEAMKILNRFSMRNDKYFKMPTDQETNRTLKDIAKDVEINRLCNVQQLQGKELISEVVPLHEILSFHFARYTYITQALNDGLNPIFVQNNVGHSKLDTTLDYNRTIDKKRFLETLSYLNNKKKTA
jgi:integrase